MILINLFSVFDPISYFGFSYNWLMIVITFFLFPVGYYITYGKMYIGFRNILLSVNSIFRDIAGLNYLGITFIGVVTFLYLIFSNLEGLLPFIFSYTAHPMITLGFGLTLWISFFLIGWLKNFKERAAHLVPEGSPLYLAPLIVAIEVISHLMRPFTLSIRLAANIIAGHLIIGLLARISSGGLVGGVSSLMFQRVLLILEFGVSVIQGFVFSILLLLYSLEYY
jgi:ATP synthase subunit 6